MTERLLPVPDDLSAAYWQAATDGILLIQQCRVCGRHQFYPRRHCAACLADEPRWVQSNGTGTLYSFTIVHRTPNTAFSALTPYVLALVDLDEGVRITTNVVDVDDQPLRCGARVRIVFQPLSEDISLPCAVLDVGKEAD